MNAVEIADAVSDLFEKGFDPADFPFAFLEAFGNKETTIKRLRKGDSNSSDVLNGVLQRNNIHLSVCEQGNVAGTLHALKESPKTASNKVKFILATDGEWLEAEELISGEVLSTPYSGLPSHFAFFLPLAGISTVTEIKDNPIDIRATGRLNNLYIELLKENPEWATEARRPDMNHFMARLIFCFFAEDTHIFQGDGLFTQTISRMTQNDGSNVQEVIGNLFEAMNLSSSTRKTANLPLWAEPFPYVNGGLFSGSTESPRFTRIARSYLIRAGELNWRQINPDIFGSMIQAVAEDEERGALGMHYTSVPNILKVLNPLFLDDLRAQLETAGDNPRMLLNLRKRMARIRIFDPACGSGNFLVIAYKEMRKIEAEINQRRGEVEIASEIPLTNFRGIELRNFAAEIARLALIIAEYQCDVLYRGEKLALAEFLPLNALNWIVCDNALRLDWLQVCPLNGIGVKVVGTNLFNTPLDQAEIDFTNTGGENYICGNPPYKGSQDQTAQQKQDLEVAFSGRIKSTKSADYVAGWFILARTYIRNTGAKAAFVTTNSINQGRQVALLWPAILSDDLEISFAVPSFPWSNLASKKATVTVSIIGLSQKSSKPKLVFVGDTVREAAFVGPYLVPNQSVVVSPSSNPLCALSEMTYGSMPNDGGGLIFLPEEARDLVRTYPTAIVFVKRLLGSHGTIHGQFRYCLWIPTENLGHALEIKAIRSRLDVVKEHRQKSDRQTTNLLAKTPHLFGEIRHSDRCSLVIPRHSTEERPYLPFDIIDGQTVVDDSAILLPDYQMHEVAIYASRLHLIWIAAVCGKIETRYRYSNTLGWNTFPVPPLTQSNKAELTRCAEDILLAREAHFPATIADLYDPDNMPDDLRRAHERNDELLERIYIGRRFKNDTERLEKLFEMYTKMTEAQPVPKKAKAKAKR